MSNIDNSSSDRRGSFMTVPLSERGFPRPIVFILSFFGVAYLTYPSLGIFEFLPDALPVVGHLDEGGAYLLLWYGLLEVVEGRRRRNRD